jgi:hypothetical protein
MNTNYKVNRSVINYIHAKDYFPKGEIEVFTPLIKDAEWIDTKLGKQLNNFNIIFKDIDIILGKMVGDLVEVKKNISGTFRKTINEVIHFEDFTSLEEWRFIVALEENEFKTYTHSNGYASILDYYKDSEDRPVLDYLNVLEWSESSVIKLKTNDVLFFRPWIFHSFKDGIIHYYSLRVI